MGIRKEERPEEICETCRGACASYEHSEGDHYGNKAAHNRCEDVRIKDEDGCVVWHYRTSLVG